MGPPVVLTYSWDRLMIDPSPGPRTAADFIGLREVAPGVAEVVPSSTVKPPAGSTLPRLAADLPVRLLLLDPSWGATGMAVQIAAAAQLFDCSELALVDVGGDALTDGTDPGLRSPLADQLALAACVRTGLPARLLITGAALDGELPHDVISERLARLDAEVLPPLDRAEVDAVRHVFTWHPSEASGLLVAAANGLRGRVEVRDAGDQVELTDATTAVFAVDARSAAAITPAQHLTATTSLDDTEQIIRDTTGLSEIEYETRKAARLDERQPHQPTSDDLSAVDRAAAEAHARGADFISARRLSEIIGATTPDTFAALSALLTAHRPDHFEPPVYRTEPAPRRA